MPRTNRDAPQQEKRKAYSNDPLARFLLDTLTFLSPIGFAMLMLGIMVVADFGVSALAGYLLSQGPVVGLIDWRNIGGWVIDFFGTPIVAGFYLWMPLGVMKALKQLQKAQVVRLDDHELTTTMVRFNRRWLLIASISIAVLFGGAMYWVARVECLYWYSINPTTLAIKAVIWTLTFYMLIMIIAREIVAIGAFRTLFRNKDVRVYPLHPDRCGGLKALNQYAMTFNYLIAIIGLIAGIGEYQIIRSGNTFNPVHYPFHIASAACLLLGPICFFLPLGTAHEGMKTAKDELLLKISRQFEEDYSMAHTSLKGSAEQLEANLKKVKHLQELYELTESFPVWPFDVATLRKFAATMSGPLVPVVVAVIEKLVLSALRL